MSENVNYMYLNQVEIIFIFYPPNVNFCHENIISWSAKLYLFLFFDHPMDILGQKIRKPNYIKTLAQEWNFEPSSFRPVCVLSVAQKLFLNFWTVRERYFKFCTHTELMKCFQMTPRPWPWYWFWHCCWGIHNSQTNWFNYAMNLVKFKSDWNNLFKVTEVQFYERNNVQNDLYQLFL